MKTLAIGCDHAGFELKVKIKEYLLSKGFQVADYGTNSTVSVDYPDIIHPLAFDINRKRFDMGIIICGSGNGVAMTANKYLDVRAALCWNVEIAEMARKHNDANIICLPARYIKFEEAILILTTFIDTGFEGGRHLIRVEKISKIIQ
jgi:ribose 5-phosphate isomerase B